MMKAIRAWLGLQSVKYGQIIAQFWRCAVLNRHQSFLVGRCRSLPKIFYQNHKIMLHYFGDCGG
ncbi:hypothetical protein [Moraxella sp.]|uniref:hypothetical protein n=1 Tax=Moraxella sp. TaxID=479 RepID=UPI0026DC4986|nr:hypothetical protein [Moraxella sp.]MDO4894655.1 hypothetical protein [Moraxella sp.]